MTTIRVAKRKQYVVLDNQAVQDGRLTLAARGLHHLLLSYPDDWEINVKHLVKTNPEGRDKIYKLLGELEKLGYLERNQGRSGGKFRGSSYLLHELPLTEKTDAAVSPFTEKPYTANPDPEKPYTANPDAYKVINKQITDLTKELPHKGACQEEKSQGRSTYNPSLGQIEQAGVVTKKEPLVKDQSSAAARSTIVIPEITNPRATIRVSTTVANNSPDELPSSKAAIAILGQENWDGFIQSLVKESKQWSAYDDCVNDRARAFKIKRIYLPKRHETGDLGNRCLLYLEQATISAPQQAQEDDKKVFYKHIDAIYRNNAAEARKVAGDRWNEFMEMKRCAA